MAFTPTDRVELLDAVKDPNLLGAFELWPVQVEMLEAVAWAQRSIWCCGRRSSKSTLSSIVLLWMALLQPQLRDCVLEDERISFVAVAANREQARIVLNSAKRIVKQSRLLAPLIERETDTAIDFANGSSIEAFVCSSRTTRGWPIAALICDEFAWFTSTEEGPQTAANVYKALSPSTLQFGAARKLIISSTPNGPGTFKDHFDQAFAAEEAGDETVAVWRLPSWEVNPTLDQAELDRERAILGPQFEAEYEAQFLAGAAALLAEADIRACLGGAAELLATEGTDWICGADFAWRRDRSAAVILGRDHLDSEHLRVAAVRTWEPATGKEYEEVGLHQERVLEEVAAFARSYGASIVCDTYESAAVSARLQAHGVNVQTIGTGGGVRGRQYAELAAKVRLGQITLLDHPLLVGELRRLKMSFRGTGPTVENPRAEGGHGDVAASLAQAVYHLAEGGGGGMWGFSFMPGGGPSSGSDEDSPGGGGLADRYRDSPIDNWKDDDW